MLHIIVPSHELFDEATQSFSYTEDVTITLEHSLVSLSKWESRTEKPFLGPGTKTKEETLMYIQDMIISDDFPPDITERLTEENFRQINAYVESKQTATTFAQLREEKGGKETITSELIYYWMVMFNIPFVCETWHLNRLFSLIRICNIKQQKPNKKATKSSLEQRRALNEQRRAALGSAG